MTFTNEGHVWPDSVQELLDKHTYENLPPNVSVFWSSGGTISDSEARTSVSLNEELALSYVRIENIRRGDPYGENPDHIRTMDLEILGYYSRYSPLPQTVQHFSHFEQTAFWKELSERFVKKSSGTIAVAVAGTHGNTHFRRTEFPAIMENNAIHSVKVLRSKFVPNGFSLKVRRRDGQAVYISYDKIYAMSDSQEEQFERCYNGIYRSVTPVEPSLILSKEEWAQTQKQEWVSKAIQKLEEYFTGTHRAGGISMGETKFLSDRSDSGFLWAKVYFFEEVQSIIREIDRLTRRGDTTALLHEHERLRECRQLVKKYPEILVFDGSITECERKYDGWWFERHPLENTGRERTRFYTRYLGEFFLKCDESFTLIEKNSFWGRYDEYDYQETLKRVGIDTKDTEWCFGNMQWCEDYTRRKFGELVAQLS